MARQAEAPQASGIVSLRLVARLWGLIATLLSLLYTVVLLGPAAIASLFDDGHYCTPIFKLWAWLILHTCGLSVDVEGLENLQGQEAFVLVSNHQSLFDIVAVLLLIPREIRFLAKRELKKIPILGFTLERSENIVIDRASGGKTIRRALAVVSHGYSICVFAEGHRFSDDSVHEFNDGAAWLAIATKLPCVPMAIRGTVELMPRGAKLARPGQRVRIVLRKPVTTEHLRRADRKELSRRLHAEVRAAFDSGREETVMRGES